MEGSHIIAAHTPKRLKQQALDAFVSLVLKHSTPPSMNSLQPPMTGSVWMPYKHTTLDRLIMTTESTWPELLSERNELVKHLQELKHWWDNNDWLGRESSEMRRQIRECFTVELELLDPNCQFPLFRILLQLIFSKRVGGTADAAEFPYYPKVQLELRRQGCPVFAEVLRSLQPFNIEEISTQHIIFGDIEPWLVIIKNSPHLKKVHFRQNISEEVLLCVGRNCPKVETFIVEQVMGRMMISVDLLYQTFFSGNRYDAVVSVAKTGDVEQIDISFPNLQYVDFGNTGEFQMEIGRKTLLEFLYNLLFFYPNMKSLSCLTMHPFRPHLQEFLPEYCRHLSYNISHVNLSEFMAFCYDELFHEGVESFHHLSSFKKVDHLTVTHYTIMENSIDEEIRFAVDVIPRLKCKKLTFHIPFITPQDLPAGNILTLYTPLFTSIGNHLSVLHFHVYVAIDLIEILDIISCCPNLEVIGIRLMGEIRERGSSELHIQHLAHLTSLSVACAAVPGARVVNTLVEKFISAAPLLVNLELMLPYGPCDWLMGIAANKMLNKIETFRLSFSVGCLNEWSSLFPMAYVGASFYVPLVELMPSLKVLMLGILPIEVFFQVKSTYQSCSLKIVTRGKPYIGYAVMDSV